jgi:hypothetical protein
MQHGRPHAKQLLKTFQTNVRATHKLENEMKTFNLVYIDSDSKIVSQVVRFRIGSDTQYMEVDGKERILVIDNEGCYPRLMHVCADGRQRAIGQYPSFKLGRDWSESLQLQDNMRNQLRAIRLNVEVSEEAYTAAVKTLAEQVVAMVRGDYPDDVEMQRGEAGDYLGSAIEDIQAQIESLLD